MFIVNAFSVQFLNHLSKVSAESFFSSSSKMNFNVILHTIIGVSMVIASPVDVNNDDRPLINYISPYEADKLVNKIDIASMHIFHLLYNFSCRVLKLYKISIHFYDHFSLQFSQRWKKSEQPS